MQILSYVELTDYIYTMVDAKPDWATNNMKFALVKIAPISFRWQLDGNIKTSVVNATILMCYLKSGHKTFHAKK